MTLPLSVPHLELSLCDVRLERVAHQLLEALGRTQNSVLARLADHRAQRVAFSRFLHNPRVHLDQLLHPLVQHDQQGLRQADHQQVLVVRDTTEVKDSGTTPGFYLDAVQRRLDQKVAVCFRLLEVKLLRLSQRRSLSCPASWDPSLALRVTALL